MTLNVNLLLCHQSYARFNQTAEARITDFHYKVALYLTYLHNLVRLALGSIKGNLLTYLS